MEMNGEQLIAADRQTVWNALNDPDILRRCIPGCQELVKRSDTEMTATAVIKVGPISAKFEGDVTLSELDPPNGYRISGEGKGGVAGHAKGGALVQLISQGDQTLLRYEVAAQVGGKLAQLGGRMIDATARSMSAAFFKKFAQELSGDSPSAVTGHDVSITAGMNAIGAPIVAPGKARSYLIIGLIIGLLMGLAIGSTGLGMLAAASVSPEALASLLFLLIATGAFLIGRLRA
jgi:carbon monoxide dehydrogenase subunit G